MPFEPINAEKLSDAVVRQIELLILRGILRPGERLPSERELSERLGVSRPSLRDAVAILSERGLVESRKGAGIFVSDALDAAFPAPLVQLFATHPEAVTDTIAFRRDMEGLAAARAAQDGSDTDLAVIGATFARMEAAHDKRAALQEAELDAEFHLAIVEASHNSIMLHMMRSIYQLLREGVFFNRQIMFRQRATRGMLLDQHRAINTAIQSRDAAAARAAVEAHMDFVQASLEAQRKSDRNEAIAQKRLAQQPAAATQKP